METQMNPSPTENEPQNETLDQEKKPKLNSQKIKRILLILLGLQLLALGVAAYLLLAKDGASAPTKEENRSTFVTMIPIWFGALIPLIVTRKKNQSEEEKRKTLYFMLGLAGMVLLGAVAFLIFILL